MSENRTNYTLGHLVEECELKYLSELAKPIRRITDFEYDTLLDTDEDNIDIKRTDILNIIHILKDKKIPYDEKLTTEIDPAIYNFVKEQAEENRHLISFKAVSEKSKIPVRKIQSITHDWHINKPRFIREFSKLNIFRSTTRNLIDEKKVNSFIQLLLVQLALENRDQKKWVRTSDVAFATRSNLIEVSLLEQVQDINSTKGRVIAFAKTIDNHIKPIVRWYNGSISFANNLQHSPRSSGNLSFKSLKRSKRVCSFLFPLNEITNQKNGKRNIQLFNVFLRSLEGKNVEFRVSLREDLQATSGRVLIRLNPLHLNTLNLDFNPNDLPNIKAEKEKAYGKNGVSNEEMVHFLTKYADSNTQTFVKLTKSNDIFINSTSYPVTIYLKNLSTYQLIESRATENLQSVGDYIRSLSDLNETESQLSVYKHDYNAFQLKKKEILEKHAGRHLLNKLSITPDSAANDKSKVKSYLQNHNILKNISDIILDDPVVTAKLAEVLNKDQRSRKDVS